jgi:hypothetical protein
LALGRIVFQLRCHATGRGGKRRHNSGKLIARTVNRR